LADAEVASTIAHMLGDDVDQAAASHDIRRLMQALRARRRTLRARWFEED